MLPKEKQNWGWCNRRLTLKFINPTCGDVAYAYSPSLKVSVPAEGEVILENLPEEEAEALVEGIRRRCRAIKVDVLIDEVQGGSEPEDDEFPESGSGTVESEGKPCKPCNPCDVTADQLGVSTIAYAEAAQQEEPETEAAEQVQAEVEAEPVKEEKPFSLEEFAGKCKAEKTGSKNKIVWKVAFQISEDGPSASYEVKGTDAADEKEAVKCAYDQYISDYEKYLANGAGPEEVK